MNQAALYETANSVQRHDAEVILKEYASVLQWRLDGKDSLLDIGCGSGGVTVDFILPLMSDNFERLVGTDISGKMIRHARKLLATRSEDKRVQFEVLDVTADIPRKFVGGFDHVTSFYCLHWVQNQRKALQSIFQTLAPNGDCLLVFLASLPLYDIYKEMSESPKWRRYMKDVDEYIGPLHYSENPGKEYEQLLAATGFSSYNVEVRDQLFVYKGLDLLKKNVKAINPFVERIPIEDQEAYMDDYVKMVFAMNLAEKLEGADEDDYEVINPYKLVVVYAKK